MKIINNKTTSRKKYKIISIITIMIFILNIYVSTIYDFFNVNVNVELNAATYTNGIDDRFTDVYRTYLNSLKSKYPNWVFTALPTNKTFDLAVSEQLQGTYSLTDQKGDWLRNSSDSSSWNLASEKALRYVMNPINFLNERNIFQFENMTVDSKNIKQTVSGTGKVLYGTPMSTTTSGNTITVLEYDTALKIYKNVSNNKTYADAIYEAGKSNSINPYYLAARIRIETACDITGMISESAKSNKGGFSVSGRYNDLYLKVYGNVFQGENLEGLYNFYNIQATGDTPVANSLRYANNPIYNIYSNIKWNNPITAIEQGASFIKTQYLDRGQTSIYLQKFDVMSSSKKQYMQNILAPLVESSKVYSAYTSSDSLSEYHEFLIPIYSGIAGSTLSPDEKENLPLGTDIVYFDDLSDTGVPDNFPVKSGPGKNYETIYTITETKEGAENREKFVRIVNNYSDGYHKILLKDGREGYVWDGGTKDFIKTYNYTHVSHISLDKDELNLQIGKSETLNVSFNPTNAYIKTINWSSDNTSVASVDNTGKVTMNSIGNANIIASSLDGNKVATCKVSSLGTLADSIKAESIYRLVNGKELQLNPVILPQTTTNKGYSIKIENDNIAKVENNIIKGLNIGNTKVTLTTTDGSNKSCEFELQVVESAANITGYNVDNTDIVTKVNPGELVSNIKTKITTNYVINIIDSNGNVLSDSNKIGTGSVIQIKDGNNILQEYKIVIYGDLNGDGQIDVVDLLILKRKLTNKLSLDGAFCRAANISKDGNEPNVTDLLRLKRHITSKNLIVQ